MVLSSLTYYNQLIKVFKANSDDTIAIGMSNYMRNQFPFYGIKAPLRRIIQKEFLNEYGLPTVAQLPSILEQMWQDRHREVQLFALDILNKMIKKVPADFITQLEQLITTKSWWDTVDLLAVRLVGTHLKRFPELTPTYPDRWIQSENLWLQRTAILHQLKYKKETDTALLFDYILQLKGSKEFFIQKAAGWALREYSKTDANIVIEFIEKNDLAPLTKREGLKWVKKKELY